MANGLRRTAAGLACVVAAFFPFHQGLAHEGDVSLHDMNAVDWVPLSAAGLKAKTVIGDTTSFVMGWLDAGAAVRPHHHVFETITYGIEGALVNTVGGVSHDLAPDRASVAFSDVEHGTRNVGTTSALFIECPPVRRTDLLPPHPKLEFPIAPDARQTPEGRVVFQDFGDAQAPWSRVGLNREASISGDQIALRVLMITPGASAAMDLRPQAIPTEQLTYLIRGTAELTVDGQMSPIKEGTLIMMRAPSSRVLFRATGTKPARLLDFHPIAGGQARSVEPR